MPLVIILISQKGIGATVLKTILQFMALAKTVSKIPNIGQLCLIRLDNEFNLLCAPFQEEHSKKNESNNWNECIEIISEL